MPPMEDFIDSAVWAFAEQNGYDYLDVQEFKASILDLRTGVHELFMDPATGLPLLDRNGDPIMPPDGIRDARRSRSLSVSSPKLWRKSSTLR